jgi:hypothetical protein
MALLRKINDDGRTASSPPFGHRYDEDQGNSTVGGGAVGRRVGPTV